MMSVSLDRLVYLFNVVYVILYVVIAVRSYHSNIVVDSLSELKNLTNLEMLDLSGNYLNGSVSGSIYVNFQCLLS